MADSEDKSSKKHAASAKKKRDAKKKGNVARSQDVPTVAGLIAGFGTIIGLAPSMYERLIRVMRECFAQIQQTDQIDLMPLSIHVLKEIAMLSLPPMFAVMITGILCQLGMVGFVVTGEQMKPKFEKINPVKGIKRWFSIKSMVELGKSLAKILIAFAVGFWVWKDQIDRIVNAVGLQPHDMIVVGASMIQNLFWKLVIIFLVIAVVDYMFQRWQWQRDLKMSDKELRDEYKNTEGDPYIKAKRRQMAQQIAMQQASEDNVPQSDVVVINPTELALAIAYNPSVNPVPMIVSKGEARHADSIREAARGAGVPVVRNKPLARALFEACEVGDIVPADLYRPVAEVLAYVLSLDEEVAASVEGAAEITPPADTVLAAS